MTHELPEPVTQNHSEEASRLPPFLEQLKYQSDMLRIMEFLVVNGLAKPVYALKRTIEIPEPKGDDPLSRLEALAKFPEIRSKSDLGGIFIPLGFDEKDHWLFIGSDGTVIRLEPPKPKTSFYHMYLQGFYNKEQIVIETLADDSPTNFLDKIEILKWFAGIVYRTDQPSTDPQALEARIKEDLETAYRVALERQKIIEQQKIASQKTFLEIFQNFPPQVNQPE